MPLLAIIALSEGARIECGVCSGGPEHVHVTVTLTSRWSESYGAISRLGFTILRHNFTLKVVSEIR